MNTARRHAITAGRLLDREMALERKLRTMTDHEEIRAILDGEIESEEQREKSIRLATAHALTALALILTDLKDEEP